MKTPDQMAEEYRDWLMQTGGSVNLFDTFRAGYEAAKTESRASRGDNDSDIDLQQQVEALQTYMSIVQDKLLEIKSGGVVWNKFPEVFPEESLEGSGYLIVVRGLYKDRWIETSRFSNLHGFMDFKLPYGKVTHWARVPALPAAEVNVRNDDTMTHDFDITRYALLKLSEQRKRQ